MSWVRLLYPVGPAGPLNFWPRRLVLLWHNHAAFEPIAFATHYRDGVAALVRDLDVIDAGTPRQRHFGGFGGEDVTLASRGDEIDADARGHGLLVIAVARKAKAESARVVTKPPWMMAKPLSMSARTAMLIFA